MRISDWSSDVCSSDLCRMFEFKKTTHHQKRRMLVRVVVAGVLATLCFMGLVGRLWYLQVVRYDGLSARADQNRIAVVPIPPRRGEILDRNGEDRKSPRLNSSH